MIEKYVDGDVINLTASADITEGQVVELTGAEQCGPTSAASTKVIGVAVITASNGDKVSVRTRGVVKVTAAGAINPGDGVQSAAAGKVAVWSASAAGDTAKRIGKALTSASADGDEITILLGVV